MSKQFMLAILTATFLFMGGCATSGDQRDPIEGLNRAIFKFNTGLDNAVFKPIAKGYRAVVPGPVDKGVSNFFGNLEDFVSAINNYLQFKFHKGTTSAVRVMVNSTAGLLGLIDVASRMGLEKHDEDFGQTLGHWGVSSGPYLMLPVLGPSSVRDTTGRLVDAYAFDPIYYIDHVPTRNSFRAVKAVDKRADLLGATSVLEEAALDKYNFVKESYFQQRQNAINDGTITFPE